MNFQAEWPVSLENEDGAFLYYAPVDVEEEILRRLDGIGFLGDIQDASGESCYLRLRVTVEREPPED